ncbi:MAG: class I SAM-dependent methyltransferase [Saprospiraceae bacterium]|nr:class I SAM-dependent methyltransferase [Saprospiraceae bacterium]
MGSYTYPDKKDKMIIQFIKEKDENYWVESENIILNIIKSYFDKFLPKRNRKMLDAGCGSGRLLPFFESYFDEIDGVEPDKQRYKEANKFIKSLNLKEKIRLHNIPIQEYQIKPDTTYDFILCSHIIQHIHSYSVKACLSALSGLLNKNGLLAITTNHSTRPSNYFMKSYLKNGVTTSEEVNEEEFNLLVSGDGILPVQFFNYDILAEFLNLIGLEIIDYKVFHIDDTDREKVKTKNHDAYFNASKARKEKYGRDMMILVRKK